MRIGTPSPSRERRGVGRRRWTAGPESLSPMMRDAGASPRLRLTPGFSAPHTGARRTGANGICGTDQIGALARTVRGRWVRAWLPIARVACARRPEASRRQRSKLASGLRAPVWGAEEAEGVSEARGKRSASPYHWRQGLRPCRPSVSTDPTCLVVRSHGYRSLPARDDPGRDRKLHTTLRVALELSAEMIGAGSAMWAGPRGGAVSSTTRRRGTSIL